MRWGLPRYYSLRIERPVNKTWPRQMSSEEIALLAHVLYVANAPSNVSGEQHGPSHVADQESNFRWDRNHDYDQEMEYDSLDVSHLELSQILGSPRGLPGLPQREIDSAPWLNTTAQDTTHLNHTPRNLNDLRNRSWDARLSTCRYLGL